MSWGWAGLVAASFAASLGLTRALLAYLRRRAILDHPNERSSHAVPTPRGGGLAIMLVLLPAWCLVTLAAPGAALATFWPLAGAGLLAALGWRDDVHGLAPLPRLLAQIAAVAIGLLALRGEGAVFAGLLPPVLDRLAAGFLWLWFVNLFNFMDGIDGIAGGEAAALGIGVALVATLAGAGGALAPYGLTAAAAALGFLRWNWQPARVFMGDVGSVPLGYLLGWLLLALASRGFWAPALILPLYYLADASLTLLRRLLRGARIWEAHREHFYQRAVQGGRSHAAVVASILLADAALAALALWSALAAPWLPLALAAAVVLLLLAALAGRLPRLGGAASGRA